MGRKRQSRIQLHGVLLVFQKRDVRAGRTSDFHATRVDAWTPASPRYDADASEYNNNIATTAPDTRAHEA